MLLDLFSLEYGQSSPSGDTHDGGGINYTLEQAKAWRKKLEVQEKALSVLRNKKLEDQRALRQQIDAIIDPVEQKQELPQVEVKELEKVEVLEENFELIALQLEQLAIEQKLIHAQLVKQRRNEIALQVLWLDMI
jgi:hypothetical protein